MPNQSRGRSRPMRGRATLTTVESRKTMPDPSTAATRIQRLAVTVSTLEVLAPHEMLEHTRPGKLVKGDSMAALRDEGRSRSHRELDLVLLLQAALLELRRRHVKVWDA